MLHDTEGSLFATIAEFQNPNTIKSAHYVLAKNGRIIQMVKDDHIAYHSRGTWDLLPECLKILPDPVFCSRLNGYSIGIELELLKTDPDGAYTDIQYANLDLLLTLLTSLHERPRTREWIKSHAELQSDRGDPRGLDWSRIGLVA